MKNAACYIRVSTDDQTEHSPESQLTELKAYAASNCLLIDPAHIYIDAGISGRKAAKRPQFQNMISAAKSKPAPFDTILVWKFSRFARNQEESILYKSLLRRECGIEVISITEETGDSMFGSLIERIIEWMDEFYSIRLGQEVRSKMSFVAEKGILQTVASFGYSKKPGEPLTIDPDESRWVKFMAENVLNKKSLRFISNVLNDSGVRTHRGNKFEPRTVEYILRNPINAGTVHWTPNQDHDGRFPLSDDTITVDGAAPAIYSLDYHNLVVAELDRRIKARKKYEKSDTVKKHWLSGYLKCGNCGSSMVYSQAHNGFQCYKYGKSLCNVSHFISATKIEAAVIDALSQVTITGDFIESITKPAARVEDYTKDIEKLRNMLSRAKRAYVEGIDTLDEYKANKERISRELAIFEEKQAQKKVDYLPIPVVQKKFSDIISLIKSNADPDTKRAALGEIVEKIVYSRPDNSINIFFYL